MKRLLPPLIMTTMLLTISSAQNSVSKILGQGFLQAVAGLAPVPEADKNELLNATALLLSKHVTFRPDGTASSIHTLSGRQHVEWKGLVVKHITGVDLTDADRLNGTEKRYRIAFGCDAHRSWDTKTNAWGQWFPFGNVTFPAGLTFDLKANQWSALTQRIVSEIEATPEPVQAEVLDFVLFMKARAGTLPIPGSSGRIQRKPGVCGGEACSATALHGCEGCSGGQMRVLHGARWETTVPHRFG